MAEKRCKDCMAECVAYDEWAASIGWGNGPATKAEKDAPPKPPALNRPLVEKSGGRCATHWRVEKKRRSAANHERYVGKTYGLTAGEYAQLVAFQGGRCPMCQRATGKTRRLSVDHDHDCCPGPVSCGQCVRGAICRPCNDLLGHARDSVEFFERCIMYLKAPPFWAFKEWNKHGD